MFLFYSREPLERIMLTLGSFFLLPLISKQKYSVLFIPSCFLQIHKFLQWVKGIYSDLPNHLPKIFEPKPIIRVKDLSEIKIDHLLLETYTTTSIHTEKKLIDGSVVTVSIISQLNVVPTMTYMATRCHISQVFFYILPCKMWSYISIPIYIQVSKKWISGSIAICNI